MTDSVERARRRVEATDELVEAAADHDHTGHIVAFYAETFAASILIDLFEPMERDACMDHGSGYGEHMRCPLPAGHGGAHVAVVTW